MTGKQQRLAERWEELADKVTDWAEHIKATMGTDPTRVQELTAACIVIQGLQSAAKGLRGPEKGT